MISGRVGPIRLAAILTVMLLLLARPLRADEAGRRDFRDCAECPEMVASPPGNSPWAAPPASAGASTPRGRSMTSGSAPSPSASTTSPTPSS